MTSAAHLICSSPKHPKKVVPIALVAKRAFGWVPIRAENMTGKNPRFRGIDKPGRWKSTDVLDESDHSEAAAIMRFFGVPSAPGPTHMLYRFHCELCGYYLPVTAANLDRALDDMTARGTWKIDLHVLSAKVSGR